MLSSYNLTILSCYLIVHLIAYVIAHVKHFSVPKFASPEARMNFSKKSQLNILQCALNFPCWGREKPNKLTNALAVFRNSLSSVVALPGTDGNPKKFTNSCEIAINNTSMYLKTSRRRRKEFVKEPRGKYFSAPTKRLAGDANTFE